MSNNYMVWIKQPVASPLPHVVTEQLNGGEMHP
jgi:hypothetical protein